MAEPRDEREKSDEAAAWARMEAATLAYRRRHYRETTPGQRIEEAIELSELAMELREAMLRAER
jgi:hypothetical protein